MLSKIWSDTSGGVPPVTRFVTASTDPFNFPYLEFIPAYFEFINPYLEFIPAYFEISTVTKNTQE